jgi:hypothetical protein
MFNKLTRGAIVLSRIFSFSIKQTDTDALKLLHAIKVHSIKRGISFSFIVVAALRQWYEQELNHE